MYKKIDFTNSIAEQILKNLFEENIQSLIIEGGKQTLETFISTGFWDEAQIFTSPKILNDGIRAPHISGAIMHPNNIDQNRLTIYRNT